MQVLRRMNDSEYATWFEAIVPSYAADKVALHRWSEEEAIDRAKKEYEQLLPRGLETEGNYFCAVLDEAGQTVGSLWFVEAERVGFRVAYVFHIGIKHDHRRRGHATRALAALEVEAASRGLAGIALQVFGHNLNARYLYSKLGYEPTNINLYKPLSASANSDA